MLRRGVVSERFITIHVVRRHVQDDRDRRMKRLDRFQLKTRQLHHRPTIVSRIIDHRDQWPADVSANLTPDNPASRSSSPISVVVVVLPLLPVIATMRPFK